MKLLHAIFTLGGLLAADEAPAPPKASTTMEQRLAVERTRRQFYQYQAQLLQMEKATADKAQEVNAGIEALKTACTDGTFDSETLACNVKAAEKK